MTQVQLERSAPAPVTNLAPGMRPSPVNWRRILLMLGPIALIVAGSVYWLFTGRYVSTDDAYVKSTIVSITSDVAGQVIAVAVNDNQPVKKDDKLVQIDPEPYRARLAAAEADIGRVAQDSDAMRATVRGQQASLVQAQGDVAYYQREFDRQRPLVSTGAVSRTVFDKAERDLMDAQARAATLDQQIRSNLAQLGGSLDTPTERLPAYLSAVAARDVAAYNLAHTAISAPRDGRVGSVSVKPGEYVSPGQALFPEIIVSNTWVEANLRETDLTHVRDGQDATFTVDAYPGHTYKARVQSASPATGSELSVLPAENATGNWVKIVQRVPLKIIPQMQPGDPALSAGLSVDVSIDTGAYWHLPAFLGGKSSTASPPTGQ